MMKRKGLFVLTVQSIVNWPCSFGPVERQNIMAAELGKMIHLIAEMWKLVWLSFFEVTPPRTTNPSSRHHLSKFPPPPNSAMLENKPLPHGPQGNIPDPYLSSAYHSLQIWFFLNLSYTIHPSFTLQLYHPFDVLGIHRDHYLVCIFKFSLAQTFFHLDL
jgi:hypothetical protein